jgi:sarcosine oxidase
MPLRTVVVGGGIFGATAARELARRGVEVVLLDPGPLPHPDASSTDISKIVRLDYGADAFYTEIMEVALGRWRDWNARAPLFHETGILVLSSTPMAPGSFEHASWETLRARGHRLERVDAAAIAQRFPAWRRDRFADGYYNPQGGWAESGRVVTAVLAEARAAGVDVREGVELERLLEGDAGVGGVITSAGRIEADVTVVAAGAWTSLHVPELAGLLRPVGQPVIHFAPDVPERWRPPAFVPWTADIARTGWYGFCANGDGVVKIANHGPGRALDPRAPREMDKSVEPMFRELCADALPGLASAPVVHRRLCLYCDSFDGDLWITRHPERAGLVVAAGGSGHGFKFAPVLGDLVADAVLGRDGPWAKRFAWRKPVEQRFEEARFAGAPRLGGTS